MAPCSELLYERLAVAWLHIQLRVIMNADGLLAQYGQVRRLVASVRALTALEQIGSQIVIQIDSL